MEQNLPLLKSPVQFSDPAQVMDTPLKKASQSQHEADHSLSSSHNKSCVQLHHKSPYGFMAKC